MLSNIKDFAEKIKSSLQNTVLAYKEELLISVVIILVGTTSYGLGILSTSKDHPPIEIRNSLSMPQSEVLGASVVSVAEPADNVSVLGSNLSQIVASKNGKAYYFVTCAGVSRIAEKNKVYFKTPAEAEARGYYLAANCRKK